MATDSTSQLHAAQSYSEQLHAARWATVAHLVTGDNRVVVDIDGSGSLAVDVGPEASLSDLASGLTATQEPADLVVNGEDVSGTDLARDTVHDLYRRLARAQEDATVPLHRLPLVDPGEGWASVSGPVVAFDRSATLWSAFAAWALARPDAVAVRAKEGELTYGDLAARARGVARLLHSVGVRRGDRVGVAAVRGLALPVALYGVLAAGAAYVPLDPSLPASRLQEMAARAGVKVVLGLNLASVGVPAFDPLAQPVADDLGEIKAARPEDLAYVIFTSGSTGRPKGVMVAHASVVNRLAWMQRRYPLTTGSVLLQKTPAVFDVSVWELFWWSAVGASMVLLPPGQEMFPAAIAAWVERYAVTHCHFIPSLLHLFAEHVVETGNGQLRSLERVFSSGEALTTGTVRLFGQGLPSVGLSNLYGPTEATVDATYHDCDTIDPPARIPIGKPIDNLRAIVLRDGRPAPPGVVGRLHLAGIGVARGYVGAPELTAEVFVPELGRPHERMYDTGDMARWTPSGELEFLGRRDRQIKIAGMRVELEEIEEVAREHGQVSECAVVASSPTPTLVHLSAFVVMAAGHDGDADQFRQFLRTRLPKHMVPSDIRFIGQLPRTPTGKVDRQDLARTLSMDARGSAW